MTTIESLERGIVLPPLPEIDDVTRREFLIGAAGILLLPAGCGSKGESDGSNERAIREINTPLGTVGVPKRAERVVALDYFFGLAFDMGVPLVGRDQYLPSWREDDEELASLPAASNSDAVAEVETILGLEPDLILSLTYQVEPVRSELEQIAPIVEVPDDFGGEWRDLARLIARATGVEPPDDRLAELDGRAAEIGREGKLSGLTAAVVRAFGEGLFRVYGPESFAGDVLSQTGLDVLAFDGEQFAADNVSVERLPDIETDVIFLWTLETMVDESEVRENMVDIEDNPLWRKLPAVRNDRAFRVGEHWIGADFETYRLVLDDLEKHLLDGDDGS